MSGILVIDNYDSFTYNLVHLLEALSHTKISVVRNDAFDINFCEYFESIVLSPGPGLPVESGNMMQVISHFHASKKILGVCLGHQAIGEFFGAELLRLQHVLHGVAKETIVSNVEHPLMVGLPASFACGRYHSWVIKRDNLPDELEILGTDTDGQIMIMAHREYKIAGCQFHPESILSEMGRHFLVNWLQW